MRDFLLVRERAARAQRVEDQRVGLAHVLACNQRRAVDEHTIGAHGIVDGQAVLLPDNEVLDAMRRRRVHEAGARIERDVPAEDQRHRALGERMARAQALERLAFRAAENLRGAAKALGEGLEQRLGDDEDCGSGFSRDGRG